MSPSLDFEVFCSCGHELTTRARVLLGHWPIRIVVEPCVMCVDNAKLQGRALGRTDEVAERHKKEKKRRDQHEANTRHEELY